MPSQKRGMFAKSVWLQRLAHGEQITERDPERSTRRPVRSIEKNAMKRRASGIPITGKHKKSKRIDTTRKIERGIALTKRRSTGKILKFAHDW